MRSSVPVACVASAVLSPRRVNLFPACHDQLGNVGPSVVLIAARTSCLGFQARWKSLLVAPVRETSGQFGLID